MRIVRGRHAAQEIKHRDPRTVQAHLLEELVVGALEEGRRGGHHGGAARPRDAGGIRHGMRFGDARVHVMRARAFAEFMGDAVGARRGGGDDHQPRFVGESGLEGRHRHLAVMLARIVRLADGRIRVLPVRGLALALMRFVIGQIAVIRMPRFAVQHVARGAHAGVGDCRIRLMDVPDRGRGCAGHVIVAVVSRALQRVDMDHHRMIDIAHFLESRDQRGNIVAGFHVPVIQAERVEQVRLGGAAGCAQTGERAVHAAEIAGDRHLVVVEHDDEVAALLGRVVQPLERHARTERTVPDHGDHIADAAARPLHVAGFRQAAGQGDRSAGVPEHELVVFAFVGVGEAGHLAETVRIHIRAGPPREHLVDVALVGHVEHDAVARRVEDAMQGHRGLHHAQIGADMAAVPMAVRQQRGANLAA